MSASNGKLSGLKGKPSPFKLADGTEVYLRPITFDERNQLFAWLDENKEAANKGMELERRLVALALCDESGLMLCSCDEVGALDPDKVDALAIEVGARCGIYRRDGEKKVTPSDSSTTTDSSSVATSPSPTG